MSTNPNPSLTNLRRALGANAVFSSLCSIAFLAASGPISGWVGIPRVEIAAIGVSLALFVAMLIVTIRALPTMARWAVWLATAIAALDVLWVVGTPLMVLPMTPMGRWIFADIALVVGVLAFFQIRALTGLHRERVPPTLSASPKGE